MNKIKLATITDSPKITSGFGNVARMLLQGFHESGMQVFSFGTMDYDYDIDGELPYKFFPSNPFDNEMGNRTVSIFLVNTQPDAIFILFDPGSSYAFISTINRLIESGNIKPCPIILYAPIEGFPIPLSTAVTISKILDTNGRVVLYSPGMVNLLIKQYSQFDGYIDFAYHGLDHANFRKIPDDRRTEIRKAVGLNDLFVVGSVGVNKRTKGFDNIIYTARCIKDLGESNIKFYLHTSPNKPTMFGYNLYDLASHYDVEDMIIFKPEVENEHGGNIKGIKRESDELIFTNNFNKNLSSLGFIDRLNMLDCYLDLSQVEGWSLPVGEAMKCGVPTISVRDKSIREEIYQGGVYWIDPEPFRMWTTWHTGVKLLLADPMKAAQAVIEMKNTSDFTRSFWSNSAMETANKYMWKPTQDKIVRIIKDCVNHYEVPSM